MSRIAEWVGAALLFGAAMAACDIFANLTVDAGRLDEISEFVFPASATFVCSVGLYLFMGLGVPRIRRPVGHEMRAQQAALAIVPGGILLWLQALESFPYLRFDLTRHLAFVNFAVAVGGHVYVRRVSAGRDRNRFLLILSVGLAYLAAFVNLAGWLYLARMESSIGTELTNLTENAAIVLGFLGVLWTGTQLGEVICTRLSGIGVVGAVARRILPASAILLFAISMQLWNASDGMNERLPFFVNVLIWGSPVAFVIAMGLSIPDRGRIAVRASALCFAGVLILTAGMGAKTPLLEFAGLGPFQVEGGGVRQIFLITSDTLRADVLSLYGGDEIQTPRLDQFAEDAVVFENAMAPSSWTFPSISSMLTGLYPGAFGAMLPTSRIPPEAEMLAERLKAKDYFTGAIVMNPALRPSHGMAQGFLDYVIYPERRRPRTLGGRIVEALDSDVYLKEPTSRQLADRGIDWIRRHQDRDFFFWLHLFDPHAPWGPPEPFRPAGEPASGIREPWDRTQDVKRGELDLDAGQREWLWKLYLQEVRYVDENVGRVLEEIRALGLYDDAAIIFASDHGEEFWEHGNFSHGHAFYQEVVHVPLLIKLPGQEVSSRIEQPVSLASIAPTVLDLAEVDYHDQQFSAETLLSLLKGAPNRTGEHPLYMQSAFQYDRVHGTGVLFHSYKYMTGRDEVGPAELYNYRTDPGETHNLRDEAPELVRQAEEHLEALHERNRELREQYGIPETEEAELQPEELEALRKLGYIN